MKLKITLTSDKKIELPTGFSNYIQAIIYNFLDRVSAQWLHEKGFKFEKRSFKLFTFSSFHEKPEYMTLLIYYLLKKIVTICGVCNARLLQYLVP